MHVVIRVACFVSCAALLGPAAEARAMEAGPLDLVWVDPTGAAPGAYSWAKAESTAILRQAGVTVRWRQAPPSEVLRPGEVAVVVMRGSAVRSRAGHLVLGASQTGTDAVSAVWVYALEVGQALGFDAPSDVRSAVRERIAFATALGRVVAHEVVHALLPRHPHAADGLMAAHVDKDVLAGPRPLVDGITRAALRGRGLAGTEQASVRGPAAVSPARETPEEQVEPEETLEPDSSSTDETR